MSLLVPRVIFEDIMIQACLCPCWHPSLCGSTQECPSSPLGHQTAHSILSGRFIFPSLQLNVIIENTLLKLCTSDFQTSLPKIRLQSSHTEDSTISRTEAGDLCLWLWRSVRFWKHGFLWSQILYSGEKYLQLEMTCFSTCSVNH